MSVETQPKIVTITKEDEAALEAKFGKNERSLDQTLKPPKQSPLRFNQAKYWPSSKSTENSGKKFLPKDDDEERITREELLSKLAIKIQEEEKEIDLNETSISGSNAKSSKSKKDLSKSLIANLDNEFETLKFKRSAAMAERDKIRKEQIKQALDEENNADMLRGTFGQSFGKQEKTLKISSTVHKNAYEDLQELLNIHNERMQAIEKEYEELTNIMVDQITDEVELERLADDRKSGITEEAKKKKGELKNYSKVDPPPSLNSYMVNPFLMKKKKETPKEKKKQWLKNIKKKRDDLKTYKEKFLEYLEDKKEKIERKKQEGVSQEATGQVTDVAKQRYNSIGVGRVSFVSERNVEGSPARRPLTQNLEAAGYPTTPSRMSVSSPGKSVKKLPSRLTSERKAQKSASRRASVLPPNEEIRRILLIFISLKKGEKPTVNKDTIWNCIMKAPQDFANYNIDLMAVRHLLYEFPSEFKNSMSFEEFVAFLRDPNAEDPHILEKVLNEIEDLPDGQDVFAETVASRKRKNFVNSVRDEKTISQIQKLASKFENFCVLTEEKLDLFRKVFYKMTNGEDDDAQVDKLAFIEKLKEDGNICKILREAAVFICETHEYVSLDRVLKQIEKDLKRSLPKQRKLKENVSLTQFLKYFTNYELNRAKNAEEEDDDDEDDSEVFDIKPDRLQFFKDIFDSIMRNRAGQTDKEAFLQYLCSTEYYTAISGELARNKAILFDLEAETIAETIERIRKEADQLFVWEDVTQFFTRRGRPLKLILSMTDIDGSRHGSKILDKLQSKDLTYKMKLEEAFEEEEEEEVDIDPTVSLNTKHMRYKREDRDHALNKKAFKAALEAVEKDIQEEEEYDRLLKEEEERKKEEDLKKKVYGSKFGALYKESADYKITEPKPFVFDARDKNKPKTIRERKVEEMLLEKEQKELEVINVYFRANEVPAHVKQPLFEKIMRAQEERRRQVKENSIAITKARENPFSFYERDQNKSVQEAPLNPEFQVRFKANPVPENTKVRNLWELMQKQEDVDRQVRIKKRSEENLAVATSHPRMAQYDVIRKAKEEEAKMAKPESMKPFRANPIPDFERLQKNFQDILDAKRKSKKPTTSKGFNFQETRKGVKRHYLDKENQLRKAAKDPNRKDPYEAVERLKAHKPKVQPPTTKKMLAMMDKLKAEREERERRLMEKREEEQKRWEKYHKMKPRVQTSSAIVDNAREKAERDIMIKNEIRATIIENKRRFEEEMRIIHERVEARPLLVEQESDKNQRLTHHAGREMIEYIDADGVARLIDPRDLTPEDLAYLQQEGYLRRPDEYGGEVAEEEGEYEDEEGVEEEENHRGYQQGHHHHRDQYEHDDEEEGDEEGEEGQEEEGIEEGHEDEDQEEYEEEEYES